ncbi:MAG: hypothetical protein IKL99_06775 [Oscillospiraceae bacterium]|nr:hypothetical protein [Oscillospiraceae bacterium]
MDLKTLQLIEKLKENASLAQSLLQTQDGKKLMALLSGKDGGAALSRAADSAAGGNPTELAAMLSQLMKSPDGAELMRRLNEAARK